MMTMFLEPRHRSLMRMWLMPRRVKEGIHEKTKEQ